MTPFTANMKLHYQCRILFFYYASCLVGFLGPFALFFSRKAAGSGMYASSILLFPYLIGSLHGWIHREIISKPFSFLLPHRQKTQRLAIFVSGIMTGLVFSLIYLAHPDPGAGSLWLQCAASGTVALCFHLLGAWSSFVRLKYFWPLAFLIYVPIFSAVYLDWHTALWGTIGSHPATVVIVCTLIIISIARLTSRPELTDKFCGEAFPSLSKSWSFDELAHFSNKQKIQGLPDFAAKFECSIERFFLSRMTAHPPLGIFRAFWGALYIRTGNFNPRQRFHGLIFFIVIIILSGYIGGRIPLGNPQDEAFLAAKNLIVLICCFAVSPWHRVSFPTPF